MVHVFENSKKISIKNNKQFKKLACRDITFFVNQTLRYHKL